MENITPNIKEVSIREIQERFAHSDAVMCCWFIYRF